MKKQIDFERCRKIVLALNEDEVLPDAEKYEPSKRKNMLIDKVREIYDACPTEEELTGGMAAWDGQHYKHLALNDRFLITMRAVPCVNLRMKYWHFKCTYDGIFEDNVNFINLMQSGVDAINNSKSFKQFLGLVIRVGNFMNGKRKKMVA